MDDQHWERLGRYLAGEADPAETSEIEQWLADDPARRQFLHDLDALQFTPPPGLDVDAALERVRNRIASDAVRPIDSARSRPVPVWRRPAARAAAVAALVLGWAAIYSLRDEPTPVVATASVHETAAGVTDTLQLADGSTVILAPGSRLTVQPGYGTERRTVELDGVAHFEVRHAEPLFTVRARDAVVTDLGTAFTVRADLSGPVRVTVSEGSVRLASNTAPGGGVVLVAGQQAVLGEAPKPAAADVAWTSGRLAFDNAPFADVASDLARWRGIMISAGDTVLAQRHLTAEFEGETADEIVRVITLALGARAEQRGDTIILHTR